jgi:thermitase
MKQSFAGIVAWAVAALCLPQFANGANESGPSRLLVGLREGASPDAVFGALGAGVSYHAVGKDNAHVVEMPSGSRGTSSSRLAADPNVRYVEPDQVRRAVIDAPNDAHFAEHQWALQTVEALKAWGLLPGRYLTAAAGNSRRLKVAVIDTGIDCTHPDFMNAGGSSTNSASGGQILFQGSRALIPTTVSAPACEWQDDFGHGTHVAGIIAAAANNGTGIAGLGYPVQLLIYKVLDKKGNGYDSNISQAIVDAADAGAAVISLSLGEAGYSQTLQDAVNYAWRRNALVVAAAGNDGKDEPFFPAGANHVLAVAATDSTGARAGFSNYGNDVGIAAPGVRIASTMPTYSVPMGPSNYAYASGTSMAAPHVSAVAGLLAMETPGLAPEAIALRIQQSANTAGAGWDEYLGYGVMDAWRALSGDMAPVASGSILGQVVDGRGLPVRNAQVSAGGSVAYSDAGGLFRIANLAHGPYAVTAEAPGFPSQTMTANVLSGADSRITVPLGVSLAVLSGTVQGPDGPIAGAVVEALKAGLVQASALSGQDGRYWISVPPGAYDVRASAVSFAAQTVPNQSVQAPAWLDVRLPRLGWITGVVRSPDGYPAPNAHVEIAGEAQSTAADTDANGVYATIGLPAGDYSVSAAALGISAPAFTVTVGTNGPATADLRLALPPSQQAIAFTPIRVNAGGPACTDSQGVQWSADYGYFWGAPYVDPFGDGSPCNVYNTERYAPVRYTFDVPNGLYKVNLKFAEIFFEEAGKRVFNVAINGRSVLTNLDVFAVAGGRSKHFDSSNLVWVSGGQIVIEFTNVVENPKVDAIEILPADEVKQAGG